MITWICVTERVPDNRRNVLTWGSHHVMGIKVDSSCFLGVSRFNMKKDGGRFDNEAVCRFGYNTVTHWAEITGPDHTEEEN